MNVELMWSNELLSGAMGAKIERERDSESERVEKDKTKDDEKKSELI